MCVKVSVSLFVSVFGVRAGACEAVRVLVGVFMNVGAVVCVCWCLWALVCACVHM